MYGQYNPNQQVSGNIGISGQFLGIPVVYWLIGVALFIAFKKKL